MLMFILFSFARTKEKRNKKENSPSAFFCLLRHFSPLNKKNSLTLKQLFVFNAPKSTYASRQKKEAGNFWSGCIHKHCFARCSLCIPIPPSQGGE